MSTLSTSQFSKSFSKFFQYYRGMFKVVPTNLVQEKVSYLIRQHAYDQFCPDTVLYISLLHCLTSGTFHFSDHFLLYLSQECLLI